MFKVVTKLVDEIFHFLEEMLSHGLPIEDFIFAIDLGEVLINLIFGDIRVDFDD
jgi:hypothetical protein